MIKNFNSALDSINALPYEFFLTGSRFFGNVRVTSDWDFYVEDSISVRESLVRLGFVDLSEVINPYPDDPNVCVVLSNGAIQIQCVTRLDLKHKAQNFLSNLPPRIKSYFLQDSEIKKAKEWWKLAYAIQSGKEN